MVRKIKLGPMIRIGFGLTLALMMGIGAISWTTTRRLNQTNHWVSHTFEVIGDLKGMEKSMVDTETGQRGFLVTNQDNFLAPYVQGKEDVIALMVKLRTLTSDNPQQQENLDTLQQLIDVQFQELEETIQLRRDGQEEELAAWFASGEGKRKMDEVRAAIAAMIQLEEGLLADRTAQMEGVTQVANWTVVGGTSGAIALGSLLLMFIGREVVKPINLVADQINNSSREISSTVEQQESAAREQAAIANQTSTTMEELGASSRQSAEQAEAAASGVQEVLILSEGGTKAVERTLQDMAMLRDKVGAIAELILRLSEQTNQIGSISGLVSDLANQTNMLALNAAVEAVRAGDHGKGFAVVSGEIRKLADQSKKSAAKISTLVNDIQNAISMTVVATDDGTKTVEQGVQIAQETAQAFSGVTNAVNNVALNSKQISLNVQQQATAIEQVLTAMTTLNQASQETASGIVQVREGTHRLNHAAIQLREIV